MAKIKPVLIFLLQSVVVGLAAAFVVVLVRPQLLPVIENGNRAPASYADAVDIAAPSVASVYTRKVVRASTADDDSRAQVSTGIGSAVVIDAEGYLVTNYHVIAGATVIRLRMANGRFVDPVVIGSDPETDLALLKVDVDEISAIPLGRSSDLRIGDVVLAIGNPYGLTKTVTQGIVSATGRASLKLMTFENYIQTDAAINEGNSGGALINAAGELVGINTAVLTQDIGTEGISFAIPIDLVRGVAAELREHGRVIRGYAGLLPRQLTRAESRALGLELDVGIILDEVYEDGPAAAAGLLRDDVVLTINGEPVSSPEQARLRVAGMDPGDEISVTAWRDGQTFATTIIVVERVPRRSTN